MGTGPTHTGQSAAVSAGSGDQATMRAARQERYGPPSTVVTCLVDRPRPGTREVVVEVAAASVHPGDYFVMTGEPYVARLAFGLRRPRNGIRGIDLAGVVSAVGADVTELRVGEEVFGWATAGALAEYACVPAENLLPRPDTVSAAEAAATPTSGMTALQALRDIARVQPGQSVLIVGASGGVGSFAVQIAKALGAEVTGVCSTDNVDLVRALGADHVIDYTATEFTEGEKLYDVIVDNVEAQPLAAVRRALAPSGTLIPNSGHGSRWLGPIGRIARTRMRSVVSRQRLRPFVSLGKREDLMALADLLASGQVRPIVGTTYRLDEAADALRHVGGGHTRGKVVIVP